MTAISLEIFSGPSLVQPLLDVLGKLFARSSDDVLSDSADKVLVLVGRIVAMRPEELDDLPRATDIPDSAIVRMLESAEFVLGMFSGTNGDLLERVVAKGRPERLEEYRALAARAVEVLRELAERFEDALDHRSADRALAEPGPNIPYEQIRHELGLA